MKDKQFSFIYRTSKQKKIPVYWDISYQTIGVYLGCFKTKIGMYLQFGGSDGTSKT